MGQYVARRFLIAIPTLIGASILAFLLLRVLPGDVAEMILRGQQGEGATSAHDIDLVREQLGLNRAIHVQYFDWIWDIARGSFGESLLTGESVGKAILHRLPITLQLALMAEIIALAIGIPLGIICAIRQDTWIDYLLRVWSIFFLAVPIFWTGLIILLIGVHYFQWIPPIGYHALWEDPLTNLWQLIFPAGVLATHELARVGRMTRSTMLEVLREDYIRTARAKGLTEHVVLVRHALKNVMIPVVTFTSVYFGSLLGGVVVLEWVFTVPGLGSLFLHSLQFRDYTMVQAIVFFLATGFIAVNLIVDLMYGALDPRIKQT